MILLQFLITCCNGATYSPSDISTPSQESENYMLAEMNKLNIGQECSSNESCGPYQNNDEGIYQNARCSFVSSEKSNKCITCLTSVECQPWYHNNGIEGQVCDSYVCKWCNTDNDCDMGKICRLDHRLKNRTPIQKTCLPQELSENVICERSKYIPNHGWKTDVASHTCKEGLHCIRDKSKYDEKKNRERVCKKMNDDDLCGAGCSSNEVCEFTDRKIIEAIIYMDPNSFPANTKKKLENKKGAYMCVVRHGFICKQDILVPEVKKEYYTYANMTAHATMEGKVFDKEKESPCINNLQCLPEDDQTGFWNIGIHEYQPRDRLYRCLGGLGKNGVVPVGQECHKDTDCGKGAVCMPHHDKKSMTNGMFLCQFKCGDEECPDPDDVCEENIYMSDANTRSWGCYHKEGVFCDDGVQCASGLICTGLTGTSEDHQREKCLKRCDESCTFPKECVQDTDNTRTTTFKCVSRQQKHCGNNRYVDRCFQCEDNCSGKLEDCCKGDCHILEPFGCISSNILTDVQEDYEAAHPKFNQPCSHNSRTAPCKSPSNINEVPLKCLTLPTSEKDRAKDDFVPESRCLECLDYYDCQPLPAGIGMFRDTVPAGLVCKNFRCVECTSNKDCSETHECVKRDTGRETKKLCSPLLKKEGEICYSMGWVPATKTWHTSIPETPCFPELQCVDEPTNPKAPKLIIKKCRIPGAQDECDCSVEETCTKVGSRHECRTIPGGTCHLKMSIMHDIMGNSRKNSVPEEKILHSSKCGPDYTCMEFNQALHVPNNDVPEMKRSVCLPTNIKRGRVEVGNVCGSDDHCIAGAHCILARVGQMRCEWKCNCADQEDAACDVTCSIKKGVPIGPNPNNWYTCLKPKGADCTPSDDPAKDECAGNLTCTHLTGSEEAIGTYVCHQQCEKYFVFDEIAPSKNACSFGEVCVQDTMNTKNTKFHCKKLEPLFSCGTTMKTVMHCHECTDITNCSEEPEKCCMGDCTMKDGYCEARSDPAMKKLVIDMTKVHEKEN